MCDLETSWMRRPWPTEGAVAPKTNKQTNNFQWTNYIFKQHDACICYVSSSSQMPFYKWLTPSFLYANSTAQNEPWHIVSLTTTTIYPTVPLRIYVNMWAGIARSLLRLATGGKVLVSNPAPHGVLGLPAELLELPRQLFSYDWLKVWSLGAAKPCDMWRPSAY